MYSHNRLNVICKHIEPDLGHRCGAALEGEIVLSDEVRDALQANRAVVALESTIISHGMSFPQNMNTALEVERIVREQGGSKQKKKKEDCHLVLFQRFVAVPATIAIIDGVPRIGLSVKEIEFLAKLGQKAMKVRIALGICLLCDFIFFKTSRRDIAYVMAKKANGATTVSATAFFARLAGIRVFVTGGIGGVHRGASKSFDISADLSELGKTSLCVVSAGVKSILDIGLTLEVLESYGVSVVTLGSKRFPAFFTRDSGFDSPLTCDSEKEIADMMRQNIRLDMKSGILVAVPIPVQYEGQAKQIEESTKKAIAECDEKGISGKQITPYLLRRIAELTNNASLESNIHLVKNNAKVGARIAVSLFSGQRY